MDNDGDDSGLYTDDAHVWVLPPGFSSSEWRVEVSLGAGARERGRNSLTKAGCSHSHFISFHEIQVKIGFQWVSLPLSLLNIYVLYQVHSCHITIDTIMIQLVLDSSKSWVVFLGFTLTGWNQHHVHKVRKYAPWHSHAMSLGNWNWLHLGCMKPLRLGKVWVDTYQDLSTGFRISAISVIPVMTFEVVMVCECCQFYNCIHKYSYLIWSQKQYQIPKTMPW